MLYDTVLLRTFAAICDAGSFTRAAREVNLTQSAVSLHVKRLEDQVGSRLIMRNTRGVRLTEHGEILLSYARRILALYKEAEHRLSRDSGGLVRIGAAEYFDLHTLSAPAWAIRRPLSRGQAANRARYRSRYLGPSRRGRAGSRDRQQRNQRGRGAAEALPALPDFEFVPRRSRNSSLAADHLAEMIINFFQLSTALGPGDGMNYKQRSHLLLRTRLEA
jgi:regulatory helix-turn-helix LysR family protein